MLNVGHPLRLVRSRARQLLTAMQYEFAAARQPKLKPAVVDIALLRQQVLEELAHRQIEAPYAYSDLRGGDPTFYATTAVVNIYELFGVSCGDVEARRRWARHILAFQRPNFTFDETNPGHAICTAIPALNILGAAIPQQISPLAPRDPSDLRDWLEQHDWRSTHKELWGATAPLIADGAVDSEWLETLFGAIEQRLTSEHAWCAPYSPPWRTISCIYHILQIYDAGRIPYPRPKLLLNRLLGLYWPQRREVEKQTMCTDADWAWCLMELIKLVPRRAVPIMRQIEHVCNSRAHEWQSQRVRFEELSTHHIYCYLWSTALFQDLVRRDFSGPYMLDTLNLPSLYRLGWSDCAPANAAQLLEAVRDG